MSAHYYCLENTSQEKQAFSDLHSTVMFLLRYAYPRGVIHVEEMPSLFLKYDVIEGKVFPSSIKHSDKVKNFYSPKAFENLIIPLKEAIYGFARLDLLLQIAALQDKELEKFIHSNFYNRQNELIKIDLYRLNSVLSRIQNGTSYSVLAVFLGPRKLSEVHQAVCDALFQYGILRIKSKSDVEKVMESVHFFLNVHKK